MGYDYRDMATWQEFSGLNRGYVLELYERYRKDPASVDDETRALYDQWTPPADQAEEPAVTTASTAAGTGGGGTRSDPSPSRPIL